MSEDKERFLLSEADRGFIKDILRPPRQPDSSKKALIWSASVALVLLFAQGIAFHFLFTGRPVQHVVVSNADPAAIRHITFLNYRPDEYSVSSAYVRRISVGDPRGVTFIRLPVAPDQCESLRKTIGGRCVGHVLELDPDVILSASSAMRLVVEGSRAHQVDLDIVGRLGTEAIDLDIVTVGGAPSTVCVTEPAERISVDLEANGNHAALVLRSLASHLTCDTSLEIRVGPKQPPNPPTTTIELLRVKGITLRAAGSEADVRRIAGTVALQDVSTHVLDPPERLIVDAEANSEARLELSASTDAVEVTLEVSKASAAATAEGSLLPTWWDRYREIWIPVFGGFFSLFVLSPLAAVATKTMGMILQGRDHRTEGGRDGT